MNRMGHRVGFIGAGSMGEAMIGAIIKAHLLPSAMVLASDVRHERLNELQNSYGVTIVEDNSAVFRQCDVIILAVKPQHLSNVLADLGDKTGYLTKQRRLIMSIAAGYPLAKLEAQIYPSLTDSARARLPIIRVMPNTPALVRSAISGMSPNRYALRDDIDTARSILGAMGSVLEFDEHDLHAVTAVSGSGPAYVFHLAEAMIEAGVTAGLTPEDTARLTIATIKGAAKLLEESADSPANLRRNVTSPGGTTEAALRVLEHRNAKQNMIDAIIAAWQRSKALSG